MMQMSDAKIHSIRQQISRVVAFPEELSNTFDEQLARDFLQDVMACQTEEELLSFTTLLPRRRLNDIFGALLVMSAAAGETVLLRLLAILRLRLTPSLAEIGWAFFQHHFPNDRMSRVLSTIVTALPDKYEEMPYLRVIAQSADLPIIDDTLPTRLAARILENNVEQLGDYLVKMLILPDSPFAASLLATYFSTCPEKAIQDNAEFFIHAARINSEQEQVRIISHYLSEYRLQPVWEPLNLVLLEQFGPPRALQQQKLASLLGRSSDTKIWDHLDAAVVDRFRQWEMLYQLDKHIGASNRKRLFYKPNNMKIREISRWDDKTLAIIFDSFVIADHQDDDDRVYYYDLNTYHILHDGSRYNVFLNKPSMPMLTVRQAMLSGNKVNIVCLQLDAVNLLYSRDFIAEQLAPKGDIIK